MEERKLHRVIDFLIILAMMTIVIVLCHPIGRNWTEEEVERYIGTEGEYSPDVDSFYYLRKAKEFSEGGIRSIKLISYREEDAMCTSGETISKEANGAMPQFLPASAALVWYGLRAVGINVGIYTVTIRFCSFLLSLFVVPVYLFLRRRTARTAAVLGSLLVALEVPFFRHSHVGFFDTDAMIGLLALVLVLSLYECFLVESRKKQVLFGVLSVAAIVLLRFTWTAFFVYGIISIGTITIGSLAVWLCRKYKGIERKAYTVPAITVVTVLVISLMFGWDSFSSLARGFLSPQTGVKGSWPSETFNIGELRKIPLSDANSLWYHFVGVGLDVTSVTGGAFALMLLLISTGILIVKLVQLIRGHSEETREVFLLSSLLTWLAGTSTLAVFGLRYMEFVTLPSALVIGLGFDRIERFCKEMTTNGKRVGFLFVGLMLFCGLILRLPVAAVVVSSLLFAGGWFLSKQKREVVLTKGLAVAILIPLGISCWVICAQEKPYIERPMVEALEWVEENTASDAVLVDFWNLGYTYQYYGERRTLADGGTYNGQFFYWLANMMITDDSQLSVGIAKMLQNCGIDGSEYAQELVGDAEMSRMLLKTILPMTRIDAESILSEKYDFSAEQIERLLDFTHPINCPELYYVASHNTFEVISSLVFYRDWKDNQSASMNGISFLSETAEPCPRDGETVFVFTQPYQGDDLNWLLVAVSSRGGELEGFVLTSDGVECDCSRVLYVREGEIVYDRCVEEPQDGRDFLSEEALMIFEENGHISTAILEKGVPDSTFIRLFLMNGGGQDVFEKVYDSCDENDPLSIQTRFNDNSSVSIWKVKADK